MTIVRSSIVFWSFHNKNDPLLNLHKTKVYLNNDSSFIIHLTTIEITQNLFSPFMNQSWGTYNENENANHLNRTRKYYTCVLLVSHCSVTCVVQSYLQKKNQTLKKTHICASRFLFVAAHNIHILTKRGAIRNIK